MNSKFFTIVLLVFLSLCQNILAHSYIPQKGEAFIFYPVSDACKRDLPGFDCFYDASIVLKNGDKNKINTKPKYRFKADKKGYTPYSEIEGHYFVVRDFWKTSFNSIKKQIFYMTLVREDGAYILLRVPFIGGDSDNVLTKSMTLTFKSNIYPYDNNYYINLPVCNKETFEEINSEFIGHDFLPTKTFYAKGSDDEILHETAKALTSFLNPIVSFDIYSYCKDVIHCDSLTFMNTKSYAFKQPTIIGRCNDISILIPAFDFRGSGDSSYGAIYSISQLFTKKEVIIQKDLDQIGIGNVVGQTMVYEACSQATTYDVRSGRNVSTRLDALEYKTTTKYNMVNNEPYNCVGTHIVFNDYARDINLVFQDKEGKQFEISARSIHYGNKSDLLHDHLVSPAQHEINIQNKLAEQQAREDRRKAEEQAKQERLAMLTKKYGKSNAKNIVEGHVRIGYSKEMCREAWGHPWEINYSEYAWGDYEQWVYKNGGYLYFKNGKLTSIQQF